MIWPAPGKLSPFCIRGAKFSTTIVSLWVALAVDRLGLRWCAKLVGGDRAFEEQSW
jgi:hypothetical protein